MQAFGLDVSTFGWLMTSFTVVSIILAFPAAGIVNKFGIKRVMIVALASVTMGSLIGTFSNGNAAVLLFSRFIEGIGMGVFGVSAPSALTAWFPKRRLGLAIGVWSMWMPLGSTVMLNLAPALCGDSNWQAVWWAGTIYTVIVLLMVVFLYHSPNAEQVRMAGNDDSISAEQTKQLNVRIPKIAIISICLIGVAFLLDNITKNGSFNTYYPTFLMEAKGMDMTAAGLITSVTTFLGAAGIPSLGLHFRQARRSQVDGRRGYGDALRRVYLGVFLDHGPWPLVRRHRCRHLLVGARDRRGRRRSGHHGAERSRPEPRSCRAGLRQRNRQRHRRRCARVPCARYLAGPRVRISCSCPSSLWRRSC